MGSRFGSLLAGGLFLFACGGGEALAEKRVALVIGNSDYSRAAKLLNPANNSAAVSTLLESAGFEVQVFTDLGVRDMRRAITDFSERTRDADVAVVFYAGHGMEIDGTNFLIPVDAALERDIDVNDEAIPLDRVMKMLEPARRLRLVILDACRDNPFTRAMKRTTLTRSIGRGLASVDPGTSTLVAFAAKAGSTAADGDGIHSPYTVALLKHIAVPGLDVRFAFGRVRDEVIKVTNNRQEPFLYGSLGGDTVSLLRGTSEQAGADAGAPPPSAAAISPAPQAWQDYEVAAKLGTKEGWDAFLATHTTGFYANLGRAQRAKLLAAVPRPTESVPPPPKTVAPAAKVPAVAAVEPETRARTVNPRQRVKHAPTVEKKPRVKQRTGAGLKSHCRRAVRTGTAWGLDNGVGIIAHARAYCGG